MKKLYAMKEFDLYTGNDCHCCEILKENMTKKDYERCNIYDVDDEENLHLMAKYSILAVPCLIANGQKITGVNAIIDFLRTH
jgi:glutaredoxin